MTRSRPTLLLALAAGGVLLWSVESLLPIGTGVTRGAQALGLLGLLAALFLLASPRARLVGAVVLGVVVATVALMPVRAIDETRVRGAVVEEAQALLGTTYVWGGENRFGIDCSGLVRTAFRRALVREAFDGQNPALLRRALELWFFDASAAALKDGYRGFATQLGAAPTGLNGIDPAALQAGDFMVTANGLHTMAYAGNAEWIEADPNAGRVIREVTPTTNGWFSEPAVLMRWQLLVPR